MVFYHTLWIIKIDPKHCNLVLFDLRQFYLELSYLQTFKIVFDYGFSSSFVSNCSQIVIDAFSNICCVLRLTSLSFLSYLSAFYF